jgi:hypothetical protein
LRESLLQNPVSADWYFTRRFQLFIKFFFEEYLQCSEYYFRVEYQHRGSPHVHGMVWMPNAPGTDPAVELDLDQLAYYVDNHVSTWNPKPELINLPVSSFPVKRKSSPYSIPKC